MASLELVGESVKSESVSNERLRVEIQKVLALNSELGSRRVQDAVEANNPNWKLNPQRFRKVLRGIRSGDNSKRTNNTPAVPTTPVTKGNSVKKDASDGVDTGKGGESGKGNKKGKSKRTFDGDSGDDGGGGASGGGGKGKVGKGKGGKGKGGRGDKHESGKGNKGKIPSTAVHVPTRDIVMNEEDTYILSGLSAAEAGGVYPEDVVTLIKKNGRTKRSGIRWLGLVERVGGYVGDNEYEDDDDEPLTVGTAVVSWIYPNSGEATVKVDDLLILDRSFAFGGSVALAKDPLNTLGFVMHNDSRYDVRVLGTTSMVRNLKVDELEPVGQVVIGQWVVHPRSQWIGLIVETEVSVLVKLDEGSEIEVTYNTEDEDGNPLPEFGKTLNFTNDSEEEHYPAQRVSIVGEIDWSHAKLLSAPNTSYEKNQKHFRKLQGTRQLGTVVTVTTRRLKVCWKASTLSNEEFEKNADSLGIPERVAYASRAPPPQWVDWEEIRLENIVRDPRDIWHVADVLLYEGKPVQVTNIHTRALVHWADGSVSTDLINALHLVPKVFMNDHDVMIFDIVSKSNAMKAENEDVASGEVGVVVKADNVNCVAEVNWLKSGEVEKLSTFDLHNHDITTLGEFVIRRTPQHKLLGHCTEDEDQHNTAFDSSLICLNDDMMPIGNSQPVCDSKQFIIALSEEMQQLAHVSQASLFHSDKLTHLSTDISVGGVIGLDVTRPNMVQVLWHDKSISWVPMSELAIVVGNVEDDASTLSSDDEGSSYSGGEGANWDGDDLDVNEDREIVVRPPLNHDGGCEEDDSDGFETESDSESDSEEEGKGGEIGDIGVVVTSTTLTLNLERDEAKTGDSRPDSGGCTGGGGDGGSGGGKEDDEEDDDEEEFFCSLPRAPSDHKFLDKVENVAAKVARKEFTILRRGGSGSGRLGMVVRCFEDRMDLLRAMIIGPQDTPYEGVPFFFDIQLPATYPLEPPKVHYVSTSSERLNPNLYDDGKVCLSLLGTWSGPGWDPSTSTLLQGFEKQSQTSEGEENSRRYNEKAKLLSLRSVCMLFRSPPQYFSRHLNRHLFGAKGGGGAGDRLVQQVQEFVVILDKATEASPTMAERAAALLVQDVCHHQSESKRGKGVHQSKSAEDKGEVSTVSASATLSTVCPSMGYLLALKRMLPTLQQLFQPTNNGPVSK